LSAFYIIKEIMVIESIANPKVKFLRSLYTKKGRRESGLFVAEGVNIVKDIPECCNVKYVFAKESKQDEGETYAKRFSAELIVLSNELFDRVSDTVSPSGITAVVERPSYSLEGFSKIMVLDGLQDAGNAGTIIRTAAACGFDAVVGLNSVDLYSPKCVRSTMGGIFRLPCLEVEEFEFDGEVYVLDMDGENVFDFIPSTKYALVVGSEAKGASVKMRQRADKVLSIPMKNTVESLNAAVSASLSMYVLENNRR